MITDFFIALKEHVACPFCPLLVIEELWNPIGNDFFGTPAKIGDIPCCGDCLDFVQFTNSEKGMLRELRVARKRAS